MYSTHVLEWQPGKQPPPAHPPTEHCLSAYPHHFLPVSSKPLTIWEWPVLFGESWRMWFWTGAQPQVFLMWEAKVLVRSLKLFAAQEEEECSQRRWLISNGHVSGMHTVHVNSVNMMFFGGFCFGYTKGFYPKLWHKTCVLSMRSGTGLAFSMWNHKSL